MQPYSPEWYEMRRTHIGASDAPIIMGVSPYRTAYQLWMEKSGLLEGQKETPGMKRGKDLENDALQEYERMVGVMMAPCCVFSKDRPWMMATLDGYGEGPLGPSMVEIKCPNSADHHEAIAGRIPKKYYPQLQHQMAVTGLNWCHYFSYNGEDGVLVEVVRDAEYIAKLVVAEEAFYECLTFGNPPALGERDAKLRVDSEWVALAERGKEIMRTLTAIERERGEIRDQLIKLTGGNPCAGGGIILTKQKRVGGLDAEAFSEAHPDIDLNAFRKPESWSWVMRQES